MPTADYFSGFPTPIVHTAQFQKCLKVFPIDDNKITHNTKISLWWWDMDNRLLAHRLITRGWFVCFSWSAGYSRSVNLCWFIFFFFCFGSRLCSVHWYKQNRRPVYTAAHKRFRGSNEKINVSPPYFLYYNFLCYWMLWDSTPHPRPFTFSASYIPLLFVLQFFHSLFLFLVPLPRLPTWVFFGLLYFFLFSAPWIKYKPPDARGHPGAQ